MSSELRVNKLTSRSGVGTVTFNDSGVIITGIATAATLDITGNATIAGVLSYDDVTNVDSVGIVTAAGGVDTNTIRGKTNNSNIAIGARASNGTFVQALTITPTRKLGLGNVSSPGGVLDVQGSGDDLVRFQSASGAISTRLISADGSLANIEFGDSSALRGKIQAETDDSLTFYTGGVSSEKVRITSAGNFGIGVTPNVKLQVKLDTNKHLYFQGNIGEIGNVPGIQGVTDAGSLASLGLRGNDLRFATGSSERMRIDSSGNVGIGGISPNHSDHKSLSLFGAAGTGAGFLQFTDTSGNADAALFADNGSLFINADYDNTASNSSIRFRIDGSSEKMRIDSSGRLLVGTSSARVIDGATQLLQVEAADGSGTGRMAIGTNNNDNATGGGIYLFRSRGGTLGSNTIVQDNDDLGSIYFHGADGTDITSRAAQIRCVVDGTPGANDMPGRLVFSTTADSATSPTERMRIDSSGNVKIVSEHLRFNTSGKGIIFGTDGGSNRPSIIGNYTSSSNNNLVFNVTGSERMRINSAGSLLVGTTATSSFPDRLITAGDHNRQSSYIDIRSSLVGALLFADGTSGNSAYRGQVEYNHGDDSMRLWTAATEKMRIDSSGRLLIGTTAGAAGRIVHASNSGSNSAYFHSTNGSSGTGSQDGIVMGMGDATNAYFWNYESGSIAFATSANERMRIDSSGRLIVGKTAHAGDALFVVQSTHTNGGVIGEFDNSDVSNFGGLRILGGVTDRECRLQSLYGNSFFTFYTEGTGAATERMRIDSSGRTSIGTNTTTWFSSQQQFVVRASTASGPASLFLQDTGGEYPVEAWNASNSGTRGLIKFRVGGSGNVVGAISTNGSTITYGGQSDHRLKENVVDIADGITRVKQLHPKRFNFIADPDIIVDGFLAHEAQTVVPEAVTGTHNEVDSDNNPVYQGIDQSKLVPLLTAALQEAIAKIETLEAKVTALEG